MPNSSLPLSQIKYDSYIARRSQVAWLFCCPFPAGAHAGRGLFCFPGSANRSHYHHPGKFPGTHKEDYRNQKLRDKTKVRHFLSEFPGKRSPYEFCRSFVGKVLFERGLLEFFKCFHIGHQPHQVSNFLLPFGIQIMIESIQLFCLNPF